MTARRTDDVVLVVLVVVAIVSLLAVHIGVPLMDAAPEGMWR